MHGSIPKEESSDNVLRNFYNVVFRHIVKLILFFVCVVVAVALATFLMTDMYQSEAKLLVQIGRESINLEQTTREDLRPVGIVLSRKDELNSEMEILQSQELAARVVDALGVNTILKGTLPEENEKSTPETPEQNSKRNRAIKKLTNSLENEVVKDSNIIQLAYRAENPRLAAEI